jgi:hypothetical protein
VGSVGEGTTPDKPKRAKQQRRKPAVPCSRCRHVEGQGGGEARWDREVPHTLSAPNSLPHPAAMGREGKRCAGVRANSSPGEGRRVDRYDGTKER